MNLSDRVWKLTDQFKSEMELALELGLGEGKSAAALSRDVRQYLNEPHRLFRRVRDEKGQLRLSKAAAAYHPGQGVYRSSFKNALRLTATENNMAYRTADHERWNDLDFVIGMEIKLSGNHPIEDICDEMCGVYPKTFKFVGWHPFCRCYAVPKLADEDEFIARQQALIDGEELPQGGYTGEVIEMPQCFTQWVQENADRIETAKNQPYFIKDNRAAVNKALAATKAQSGKKIPDVIIEKELNVQSTHHEQIDSIEKKVKFVQNELRIDAATAKRYVDAVESYSCYWDWEIRQVQCGNESWVSRHNHSLDEVKKKALALEEYIEKAPKWRGGNTYRGMSMTQYELEDFIGQLKLGQCNMLGSSSWSTEETKAREYAMRAFDEVYRDKRGKDKDIEVILIAKRQRNAVSIRHLSLNGDPDGYGEDEFEVLASMKSRYKFISCMEGSPKSPIAIKQIIIEVEAL